jgi:hypothetical protein
LPADLTGQASIIHGDTLEIHGTRIRLWGIDAPESNQLCRDDDSNQYRCGSKAANELDAFIARRPVDCSLSALTSTGARLRHSIDRLCQKTIPTSVLDGKECGNAVLDSIANKTALRERTRWVSWQSDRDSNATNGFPIPIAAEDF